MMARDVVIRRSEAHDVPELSRLYLAAFPSEPLMPVVDALLGEVGGVVSLVAVRESEVVGHIMFTLGHVDGSDRAVALLGPLAISPPWQRSGIGRRLVAAGLERSASKGVVRVLVLGDPAYYGRLGFATETDILPPYELPPGWLPAWQSIIPPGVHTIDVRGQLGLPAPWLDRALWAP